MWVPLKKLFFIQSAFEFSNKCNVQIFTKESNVCRRCARNNSWNSISAICFKNVCIMEYSCRASCLSKIVIVNFDNYVYFCLVFQRWKILNGRTNRHKYHSCLYNHFLGQCIYFNNKLQSGTASPLQLNFSAKWNKDCSDEVSGWGKKERLHEWGRGSFSLVEVVWVW